MLVPPFLWPMCLWHLRFRSQAAPLLCIGSQSSHDNMRFWFLLFLFDNLSLCCDFVSVKGIVFFLLRIDQQLLFCSVAQVKRGGRLVAQFEFMPDFLPDPLSIFCLDSLFYYAWIISAQSTMISIVSMVIFSSVSRGCANWNLYDISSHMSSLRLCHLLPLWKQSSFIFQDCVIWSFYDSNSHLFFSKLCHLFSNWRYTLLRHL
jgi:hypothetical protein